MSKPDHEVIIELQVFLTNQQYSLVVIRNYCAYARGLHRGRQPKKTDRRDAINLAGLHRAGALTAVWVPDAAHEAMRDLVRARLPPQVKKFSCRSLEMANMRVFHT